MTSSTITWTDDWRRGQGGTQTLGSFGLLSSAFTIEAILGGVCFRLKNHLPVGYSEKKEQFFPTVEAAKGEAEKAAFKFFKDVAEVAMDHPAIQAIDNAVVFFYPDQLCNGKCRFYGGTDPHMDVTMEKYKDLGWTIARADSHLFTRRQEWAVPTETLDKAPADFVWPLEDALEQIHFFHCG